MHVMNMHIPYPPGINRLQHITLISLMAVATGIPPALAAEEPGTWPASMQLVCKGALDMTFPNSKKLKRDMNLPVLAMLLQPATGVASIERLPFGAYDFRKTFVFSLREIGLRSLRIKIKKPTASMPPSILT